MPYTILPRLLLRTPFFSYPQYTARLTPQVLQDPDFHLAIYLASPAFYHVLEEKQFDITRLNKKEKISLQKYFNRMNFRPTPFGLFATLCLADWSDQGPLVFSAESPFLHLLPDLEAVCRVSAKVSADPVSESLRLNPTLYQLLREFRFIKTSVREPGPGLAFSLESLEVNTLTRELRRFFKDQKTMTEAIAFLEQRTGCSAEEAADYLAFLKEAQVLLREPGVNIVGEDCFYRMPGLELLAEKFAGLPADSRRVTIGQLQKLEEELRIASLSDQLPTAPRYFYANSLRKTPEGGLPFHYQQKLSELVGALQQLVPATTTPLLTRFISDFKKRFDLAKIPLLQAMDPDAGIGYGELAEDNSARHFLQGFQFPLETAQNEEITWSPVHRLLLEKWNQTSPGGALVLQATDLKKLPEGNKRQPPGISVLFRITAEGILAENIGGVSGTSLAGRFTVFSDAIWGLAREIAAQETAANPDVLFAEIGQLSDLRVDNINRRRQIYDYEIPVNCTSLLGHDRQLALSDLLVSVRGDELILESALLKKRIIPRLSSAYNYQRNHLAVFRFLCDLQHQSVDSNLTFTLEQYFPGMPHYPRVECLGSVISPAKWSIKDQLAGMPAAELRTRLGLPARVALTQHDQQLVFDLDDAEQVSLFELCTREIQEYTLHEFLPPPVNSPVTGPQGEPYINQFVAFLVNDETVYHPAAPEGAPRKKPAGVFIPGSSWLYLKIYCSANTADELLVRQILPLIRQLSGQHPCHWFFIRYTDPGYHIRLRIKTGEYSVGTVLSQLKKQFSGLVNSHMVREYQADTYRQELERYGADLIEPVEKFFQASSDLTLHFIKNNQSAIYRRDRLAIAGFALLIDLLLPGLPEQIRFLESVISGFYAEFKAGKPFRVELDKLYRNTRDEFASCADDTRFYRHLKIQKQAGRFRNAIEILSAAVGSRAPKRRTDLLADLIHMHLNRVYTDRQRQQELVIYYCFFKYRSSQLAIFKRSAAAVTPALNK